MKIAILEPFLGGSHRQWAEGWQKHSRHEITILGLPGRHWKWRMHGGALSLARKFREQNLQPDLLLATDMLDLGAFLGLTRDLSGQLPAALYFHENQLAYPWSPTDADPQLQRDNHYSFINFSSAVAADRLFFNSAYNRDSFLEALPSFLKAFPDHRETHQIERLRAKSTLLPLGLDLKKLDLPEQPKRDDGPPVVLWNHRWEYDKRPELFFRSLFTLAEEGIPFRLIVLGERYGKVPGIFEEAKAKLEKQIMHWGYAEEFEQYRQLMHLGDIYPVTSGQDFFGGSVVEALYCRCRPLLPRRLAYPEHVPEAFQKAVFYDQDDEFLNRLRDLLLHPPAPLPTREWVQHYDWSAMAERYDEMMDKFL